MRWDPHPELFLDPILDELHVANNLAEVDQSRYLSGVLSLFLGRQEKAKEIIASMNCRSSAKHADEVNQGFAYAAKAVLGYTKPRVKEELNRLLALEGCAT